MPREGFPKSCRLHLCASKLFLLAIGNAYLRCKWVVLATYYTDLKWTWIVIQYILNLAIIIICVKECLKWDTLIVYFWTVSSCLSFNRCSMWWGKLRGRRGSCIWCPSNWWTWRKSYPRSLRWFHRRNWNYSYLRWFRELRIRSSSSTWIRRCSWHYLLASARWCCWCSWKRINCSSWRLRYRHWCLQSSIFTISCEPRYSWRCCLWWSKCS